MKNFDKFTAQDRHIQKFLYAANVVNPHREKHSTNLFIFRQSLFEPLTIYKVNLST